MHDLISAIKALSIMALPLLVIYLYKNLTLHKTNLDNFYKLIVENNIKFQVKHFLIKVFSIFLKEVQNRVGYSIILAILWNWSTTDALYFDNLSFQNW